MSAREEDSADDSKAANDTMQGMQELILNAISVESSALRAEVRRMQKDIVRILSKLPGDSSETDLPETCSARGRFTSVRPSGAAESSTTVRSAKKDVSKGTAAGARSTPAASIRVSSPSSVPEATPSRHFPRAALSWVACPPGSSESMPRITDKSEAEVEDVNAIPRSISGISGEFHMEAQPSSTCLGKPSSTTWTSQRYRATRSAVPEASLDTPQQAQRGISHRSIVPAVAQDSEDFDGVSLLKTSPSKRQSRGRGGTVLGKSANANQAPDCSGLRTFPSEVSTAACSEAAQSKGADFESSLTVGERVEENQEEPSQEEPGEGAAGTPPDDGVALCAAGPARERCGGSIEGGLARLCGMLPWSVTTKWSTWLYQQLVAMVVTMVAIGLTGGLVAEIDDGEANLATILEALLAVGSSLGLWSCQVHRSSNSLVHAHEVLSGWMLTNGIEPETGQAHAVLSLLAWIAAVGTHIGVDAFDDVEVSTFQKVSFTVVSFLQTALVSMIVYQCNRIRLILGAFSDRVVDGQDFPRAVYEWHCVRACCQEVCRAVEACFVVMVTFASVGVLVVVLRMSSEDVSLRMVPALLLTLASFRILFYAAAVTDLCTHVPVLVNSVGMGRTLDPTRMYAVQYMRYCQSGFYIFGTRITPSGVIKVAYIACAVAFAILTQHNENSPFAR